MSISKKVHRFGWVDWLLLFMLCGLVFVGVYYWRIGKNNTHKSITLQYVLCVSVFEEQKESGDAERLIESDSAVMNQNGTSVLGNVISVQSRPVRTAVVANGAVAFVPVPNKRELLITVRASASQTEGDGFRVGDIRIAVGKQGDFRIGNFFAGGARIVQVEEER